MIRAVGHAGSTGWRGKVLETACSALSILSLGCSLVAEAGDAAALEGKDQAAQAEHQSGDPGTSATLPAGDGVVHVSAFDLPSSEFISPDARFAIERRTKEVLEVKKTCRIETDFLKEFAAYRECFNKAYYAGWIARQRARYNVAIRPEIIAGVPTEIFTPADGVAAANRQRVLINLHGGGFVYGSRWGGQVESIPIAATARIKVISVDYRLAPEYKFPAAAEDVLAVYRELLRDYRAEDIGIYGCSSGSLLTAQAVALFQKEGVPVPGAVGMFCEAPLEAGVGDSAHFSAAMVRTTPPPTFQPPESFSYFSGVSSQNALAYPGVAPQTMAKFPPSLLITATRDITMSQIVYTHSQLVRLGVPADLHIWEGLGHGFFFEPDMPESREAYDVIARFFNDNLGRRSALSARSGK
jgi:monoterpene epsilon-lactone hydrolase